MLVFKSMNHEFFWMPYRVNASISWKFIIQKSESYVQGYVHLLYKTKIMVALNAGVTVPYRLICPEMFINFKYGTYNSHIAE